MKHTKFKELEKFDLTRKEYNSYYQKAQYIAGRKSYNPRNPGNLDKEIIKVFVGCLKELR